MSRQKGVIMQKTILWVMALVFTTNIITTTAVTLGDVGLEAENVAKGQKLASEREYDTKVRIIYFAEKYSVQGKIGLLNEIVRCESSFNQNAINSTSREYSVGLSQINLLAHTNITKEQALDPNFAIEFLVKNVAEGRGNMWTCYRMLQ